ncbi:U5 small nuclear ribonucleoprotein [Venturia inaequalis]|nr:U5 small nuclear ribonucleoprotein [Venturia inaequalis]
MGCQCSNKQRTGAHDYFGAIHLNQQFISTISPPKLWEQLGYNVPSHAENTVQHDDRIIQEAATEGWKHFKSPHKLDTALWRKLVTAR